MEIIDIILIGGDTKMTTTNISESQFIHEYNKYLIRLGDKASQGYTYERWKSMQLDALLL